MLPEALEGSGPLVQRADAFRIGAIKHAPSLASYANQSDMPQNAKVLGNGWLRQAQVNDDVGHGALPEGQVAQDFAAAWFSDSVEGIGSRGGTRHERYITFLYGNMSSQNSRRAEITDSRQPLWISQQAMLAKDLKLIKPHHQVLHGRATELPEAREN